MMRLITVFLLTGLTLLYLACANQASPTGGPKDEIPPKAVASIPQNGQVNYRDNQIYIEFDEFVALNRPYQEILIVPTVDKNKLKYMMKRKTLIIKFEEGWAENTTYSVSIREGVRDITENNPPENLKLSFSTGPYIDSLFMVGKVNLALQPTFPEGKVFTVAVHRSDTFDIFEHIPYYFTETDEKGRFHIENMKAGSYYIYAFEDESKNLKVESKTEYYGFLAKPIEIKDQDMDSLTLHVVKRDARKLKISAINRRGLYTEIILNKPVADYTLEYEYDSTVVHSFGSSNEKVKIYNPRPIADSIRFVFNAQDSLNLKVDTTFYIKEIPLRKNFVPDEFKVNTERIEMDMDSNRLYVDLNLSKPLKTLLYDSLFIEIDTIKKVSFNEQDIVYDDKQKKLSISKNLFTHVKEDSLFIKNRSPLLMKKGFMLSIEGDSSEANELTIPFVKKEETGIVLIEVNTEQTHYEIQLIANGKVVASARNVETYRFEYLPVQKYTIRVMIDTNQNGQWDAGNIYTREEPEPVWFYENEEKEYEFPIRANWELGPLMLNF